jgi:anti-anti-sigma factor
MINLDINENEKTSILTLKGDITIQFSSELKEKLIKSIDNSDNISIDLEHVSNIDLSCLQLLCSAYETSVKKNKHFKIEGTCPENIKHTVKLSGYSDYMNWLS